MKIEELKTFGVPESVTRKLVSLGYKELTEIQRTAIEKGLFEEKNLIISAPTNTGKTFVGELASLNASKRKRDQRTFYLVPLKALAEEKVRDFQEKYSGWGLKVAITTGDRTEYDGNLLDYDLIIATYEKLNALLVRNPHIIKDIGVVIVDELQNIGDVSRGVGLEILLTKLVQKNNKRLQVVGLSATIPNAKELAEWLKAELVETKTREIELREGVLYLGAEAIIFNGSELNKGDFLYREFNTGDVGVEENLNLNNISSLVELCKTEQVIFFGNTQKKAEDFARTLSTYLLPAENITKRIGEMDMRVEPTPSSKNLKKYMINGVAFHHAGLLHEERMIVERAFEEGSIRVICATPTLSAGVNTPAKTIILLSYKLWTGENISTRDYKNMSGRAGRIQYHDDFGRSVLFAHSEKELDMLWHEYVKTDPEMINSQISEENIDLHILGIVNSGMCRNLNDVLDFIKDTFFGYTYYQGSDPEFRGTFEESIKHRIEKLRETEFLEIKNGEIKITELGKRCAEGMLSPETVKVIYDSLTSLESIITPKTDYKELVEPIIHATCCTFDTRNSLLFPPSGEYKNELLERWEHNKEEYLVELEDQELILRSLETTEMLLKWIDAAPYSDLRSFARQGVIKRTGETISWIVEGVASIAEQPLFNFDSEFIEFLNTIKERVYYGVPEKAIRIMKLKIPSIHRFRALQLSQSGYATLNSLIEADLDDLKKIRGIDTRLAVRIKKHTELYIQDKTERARQSQIRRATELGRDKEIIEKMYEETGKKFSKICSDVFEKRIGMPCAFIDDVPGHDIDCLIELGKEKIVIECKRKNGARLVSAREAEEVRGKGAGYDPSANVTIGYPDFAQEAIDNVKNTHVTLITLPALAEILVMFEGSRITKEEIVEILKSGEYINKEYLYRKEPNSILIE